MMETNNPRIRSVTEELLSDNWYVLKKVTFEYGKIKPLY